MVKKREENVENKKTELDTKVVETNPELYEVIDPSPPVPVSTSYLKDHSNDFEVSHNDKASVRKILESEGAIYHSNLTDEGNVKFTVQNLSNYEKLLKKVATSYSK